MVAFHRNCNSLDQLIILTIITDWRALPDQQIEFEKGFKLVPTPQKKGTVDKA
jgi:hypothetical protein